MSRNIEKKVKQMYTDYAYPEYNKYMDKFCPIPHQYSNYLFLEQLNHYIYNGKNNFNIFNILVAGVGLGSNLINMAYFLKNKKKIKIVGIDLSSTSLDICKKRVKKYNLQNVTLIEMSLLDLDPNIHGTFDLIISVGVLHHLEDPILGLNSLKTVLKEDGSMALMVYGKYGRTGVYQMQDLMKHINYNEQSNDFSNKIQNFKTIYKQLPNNNWFKKGEHLINDHKTSDAGIVDLVLHHQDRSYNVKELFEWIEKCELYFVDFSPENRYKYKYNIKDINYSNNIVNKYSINELFFGDIIKHSFWITKQKKNKCTIEYLDNIMILLGFTQDQLNKLLQVYIKDNKINTITVNNCNLKYNYYLENIHQWCWDSTHEVSFKFKINEIIYCILKNINNKTTTKTIFNKVRKHLHIKHTNQQLLEIFKPVYEIFELYDLILLKK